MLKLLVLLEYKRQTVRRMVLGMLGVSGDRYFAFAPAALALSLLVIPIVWPAFVTVALPAWVLLAFTLAAGIFLLFTIILAPVGLILL